MYDNYQREKIKKDHSYALEFMANQIRNLKFEFDEPIMTGEAMLMVVCLLRYFDELDINAVKESPDYYDEEANETTDNETDETTDETGGKPARATNQRRLRIVNGLAEVRASVLIFVPGMEHIKDLQELLMREMPERKLNVLPLHSDIVLDQQKLVFDSTLPFYRKVIISTTIAESSITVPDVKVQRASFDST